MKITGIYSTRNYNTWPSWHIVFEYEDKFAECLGIKITRGGVRRYWNSIQYRAFKIFPELKKLTRYRMRGTNCQLVFIMSAGELWAYPKRNTIPILLDTPMSSAEYVLESTKELPIFWVTAFDYYKRLKELEPDSNVKYIPLAITDIYKLDEYPDKKIDVIQFGRKNDTLHNWMLAYCKKYPGTEYVYQTEDGSLTYISTTRGNIGRFDTRRNYFEMLKASKISLVSTPCFEGERKSVFGNMDFVTPRFYESAVNYCYMIGRYTENDETTMLGLEDVCDNVSDCHVFEELVYEYLMDPGFKKKNVFDNFIARNVVSARVREVNNCLFNLREKDGRGSRR